MKTFEEWAKRFEENTKKHERALEHEEMMLNWEIQIGYDEYRFETAAPNALPFRRIVY